MKLGQKIIVVGCPGSGKSTLSKELRDVTGLPLFHLDNIWWKPDKSHISREEFDQKLDEILLTDRWMIDGNERDQRTDWKESHGYSVDRAGA